jgi:hypothetical protein
MYDQLPPGTYPKTVLISHSIPVEKAEKIVEANKFGYPFAVKPDVGMMGFMFRTITTKEDFQQYHKLMPADYLVQEFVDYPLELSVFYYRFPNERKGNITGFIKKEFLSVTGDGNSTLLELISNYDRVRFRIEEMKSKHKDKLNKIIPEGEVFYLSRALNLSRGGKLVSLAHEKDERLLKVFDDLSHFRRSFLLWTVRH